MGTQAFASPPDMASSGVWENIFPYIEFPKEFTTLNIKILNGTNTGKCSLNL